MLVTETGEESQTPREVESACVSRVMISVRVYDARGFEI